MHLDPVTFEVLRNRLWTINVAHGETLIRISGSPIFQAFDFNMVIMAEDGEAIMNAPFIQYLNSGAPIAVAYTLENYSDSPGIEEADIFIATDPWIGASHQMDVCIFGPVFVDGKLFGWVSNAAHQYDLGGIVPGGWPQNAVDVYSDPAVLRPFKIVEQGILRKDLEQMYRRQSRMPDLLAFDLRAQLAGVRYAVKAISDSCAEFGAPTVKAAMRRILDQAQEAFADKLRRIPDGVWSDVRYVDENLPGERTTNRIQLNVEKTGDRLVVHNVCTDEQLPGPVGFVFINFAGGFAGVLSVTMLYEHTFSIGGADRQIEYRPLPGRLTCVDYPAAVSGSVMNIVTHMHSSMSIVGRMLVTDPDLERDIICGGPEWPLLVMAGVDDRGVPFGTGIMDTCGAGAGAKSFSDGVDGSGPSWSPLMRCPNVEASEQFYPLLFLYRRELADSAGAGRWRGGIGIEYAMTPYRATHTEAITNTGGMGVSTHNGPGLFGGYPSPAAKFEVYRSTNLKELLAGGEVPRTADELQAGERFRLRGKSNGTPLGDGDVIVSTAAGGGGFGDPLDREPELVARDVSAGHVSVRAAGDVYGVVVGEQGVLEGDATEHRRAAIRAERAAWHPAGTPAGSDVDGASPATGQPPRSVHHAVVARDEGTQRVLACMRCDHVLSGYAGNYKLGLLVDEGSVTIIPPNADPSFMLDEDIVFRRYCCPGCQTLMTTEIVRRSEPVLQEMRFT
jgi:N-methylhydantoinase B